MSEKTTVAITIQGLTKAYKNNKVLRGVNISVQKGSIFALLGSNGAGKTTIVKILSTLIHPDGGSAEVLGLDVVKQAKQVRNHISLTGQFATVDEQLTGKENLLIIGALWHVSDRKEQADKLLEMFQLTNVANKRVSTYSGGMRRRLDIAMGMMGQSSIVFLDEPTTGLDPQSRLAMWNIVKLMSSLGKTVFLTTQYLDEADYLADYIAVLHEGVIIADGTSEELKKTLPQGIIQIQFNNELDLKKAKALLDEYPIRDDKEINTLNIQTDSSAKAFADVLNRINEINIEILKFTPKQPTLEDAFLILIGEKKEDV
ncbi:MAG: ATP-binding cassette domain-containing protein [Oscillospiraceae bacterium]|nr:ATP-binding cassette domain-containing protein [Oscillospiraceae bacterium]